MFSGDFIELDEIGETYIKVQRKINLFKEIE